MTIELISNTKKISHAQKICKGLSSASEIFICTAFLKVPGLTLIRESLEAALHRGATATVLVGLDFFITDPKALRELFDLMGNKKYQKRAHLLICAQSNETFHPKLYFWRNGKDTNIVIGSANLTSGGLTRNIELSVMHSLPHDSELANEVLAFRDEMEKHERVEPATEKLLSQYGRKWEIYSEAKKAADSEAKKKISEEFKFDVEKLNTCLKEYRHDKAQKINWKEKQKRYLEARKILDHLTGLTKIGKRDFLSNYEKLIEGDWHFWSSGGLSRNKNQLAQNHKKFLALLKQIRNDHSSAPMRSVLDEVHAQAKKITGLGWNVITEILNTFAPTKFGVFNGNSTGSLAHFGFERFKNPAQASVEKYVRFNRLITELAKEHGFSDLSQVDHFLNWVYWKYVKPHA